MSALFFLVVHVTTYHKVLLLTPIKKKETLSWKGVDFFPAGRYWEQAAALLKNIIFSY